MIYVDKMVNHGKRIGHAGPSWCHLFADDTDELHTFAQAVGLQRSWFQDRPRFPHYDIGSARIRAAAVAAGAQEMSAREMFRRARGLKARNDS